MTQSFDIDKYNSRECEVHNHGFYLGAQSKQSEIDELRKRIDEAIEELEYPTATWEETVFCVIKILKGTTNEQ